MSAEKKVYLRYTMDETTVFFTLVALVTAATCWRLCGFHGDARVSAFLTACFVGQLLLIHGLGSGAEEEVWISHAIFTSMLWAGLLLPADTFEHRLCILLCVLTVATRILYGHCMISQATDDAHTSSPIFHLLYAIPAAIGVVQLLVHKRTATRKL